MVSVSCAQGLKGRDPSVSFGGSLQSKGGKLGRLFSAVSSSSADAILFWVQLLTRSVVTTSLCPEQERVPPSLRERLSIIFTFTKVRRRSSHSLALFCR